MPFTTDAPAFRAAHDRIAPRMRACAGCGLDAPRLLKAEDGPVLGPVLHTVCAACGLIQSYAVDVAMNDPEKVLLDDAPSDI